MNFVTDALSFQQNGLNPLPLRSNKAPKLPTGHNFLYSGIDRIEHRFLDCDMIGIACGPVSGGFYAIDFDKHGGQDIESVFNDFTSEGLIAELVHSGKLTLFRTPSGGYHCYYKYTHEIKGKALSRWSDGQVMVEIRGNGQYVATTPSPGYTKINGVEMEKLDFLEDNEYANIVNLISSFDKHNTITTHHDKTSKQWPDKWDDTKLDGNFNNTQAEYAKTLLTDAGWRLITTRKTDGVELWEKPRTQYKGEVSATFGVQHNMFYVFSTSALPFQANTAYTPFNIYTILKYVGDWKRAKDSLRPKIEHAPEEPQSHSFFPIEVFPDFLQKYILELNRTLNFHPDFSAAAAMFTLATINGNKYKLKVKNGWEAPTIFWFACVGHPGTIKTHPVKMLTKPINNIDLKSKVGYDEEMRHYNPEQKQPKPKFKQVLISDYTLEALHSIHDINKRGIGLYKDELKGFLNDMNKYRKGSDEEFWLESFNNGSYIVNRVTKEPIMINNICINIIGTIQHDVLNKVVTDYAGNGLIDRFLFTASESKVYPISTNEIENHFFDVWNEVIAEMNTTFKYHDQHDTEVLSMSPATFEIYQAIDLEYVTIQNNEHHSQEIKNYLSKMKTYIPRFALLLAIMEGVCNGDYIEVTPTHMTNAKKIADYFVKTAQNVYTFNSVNDEIRQLEATMRGLTRTEKVRALFKKGISQSNIARFFGISRQNVSKLVS